MCTREQFLKTNFRFTQCKAVVIFDWVDKTRQTCVNFTEKRCCISTKQDTAPEQYFNVVILDFKDHESQEQILEDEIQSALCPYSNDGNFREFPKQSI